MVNDQLVKLTENMSDEFGYDEVTKSGPYIGLEFKPAAGLWMGLCGSLIVLVVSQACISLMYADVFAHEPEAEKAVELAPGPWLDKHEDLQMRYEEVELGIEEDSKVSDVDD